MKQLKDFKEKETNLRIEIRLCGSGGQGAILASTILGESAILDGMNAAQTQSYGAEVRGAEVSGDVVISDDEIKYPLTLRLKIVVAMSGKSLLECAPLLSKNATLIVDDDLVKQSPTDKFKLLRIPATRLAEKYFGRSTAANIIMLGFLSKSTGAVSYEALKKAIRKNFGEKYREALKALKIGYKYDYWHV